MLSNERTVCESTCFIGVLQQTTPLLHTKGGLSGSSTAPGMGANTIWAQERHSLSASADFGSPWAGGVQTLHSDTCRKILKLHNDTSAWYCSSTLVPHQCCSHHDSNWPPFKVSGHGGIGSLGPDLSLTRKHQAYWLSPRPWCLTSHHPTLLQVEL